eukprot:m.630443 g.630443  ORF g.630443 m.630443 type:complete len:556 (-) comp22566_c0_seq2:454-2121(-)
MRSRHQTLVSYAVILVTVVQSTIGVPLSWTQIIPTGASPPPRSEMGIAYDSDQDTLWIFGGESQNGVLLDDTWGFNFNTNTWTEYATGSVAKPAARFSVISGYSSAGFVVSVGEGDGGEFFNDVWVFNTGTRIWQERVATGSIPEARYGAAGGIFGPDDLLYVSHGFSSVRYSDSFTFNLTTNTWTTIFDGTNPYNPYKPHARCLVGSAMVASKDVIMYGGCLSGGKSGGLCPAQDTWHLQSNNDWVQASTCPTPRLYAGMSYFGSDSVILYGGQEKVDQVLVVDETPANQVAVLSIRNDTWKDRTVAGGSIPVKRYSLGMRYISRPGGTQQGAIIFGGQSVANDEYLNDMWLLQGSPVESSEGEGCKSWLSLPMLHGIFMLLGWGVFIQAGHFIARYFRQHGAEGWWFKRHKYLMMTGLGLSLLGFIFGVASVKSNHFSFTHGLLGIEIMILGIGQPINAYFRPHPPSNRTKRRIYWEYYHKYAGRLAIFLALINITLGIFMIGAPPGFWIFWCVILSLWVVINIIMEVRLRKRATGGRGDAGAKSSSSRSTTM